ncbi:pyruvate carboxylase [Clostridium kluyveri]|uniref:Pyruvate carboxylase n=1 Tax=Clostridium kluyveri TaxID=1534 RepID=A0A1L5F437_CLOKL|nr:pyruvate carboxylase [Clostridium kluyveri]APM37766.1 pyruvate carboxylase [Clostridium kluyveri]UZQ52206.1 pyruvate carboxylase [Clostridium kluyveri]
MVDLANKFKRVLVANRGEIAIRIFRACEELGITTVAIYSKEDKRALFRTKADESYLLSSDKGPIEAYLDIDKIINIALKKKVDAIHPGYGFLAENPELARKCEQAGIEFIGPTSSMMEMLGDKIKSKIVAKKADVPTIPGIQEPIKTEEQALEFARYCGYPVMVKAAAGGGGRGMRIVREEKDLLESYNSAKSESMKAFGSEDIFIEKYIESPKHIEVQILGDKHGNVVHLYERDCSIQRRHQKVIEFTPSIALSDEKRNEICEDALKIARSVGYRSAGTLEFLVDKHGNHYFIEMNTRIQVEHTVTEMVTGIDLVQDQILVAEGYELGSKEIGIKSQDDIKMNGYAIQCRITTEDPLNNFAPDTGRIDMYRTGSGFGIRLDGGNGFTGAVISPYYDSLLVKNISWARTFEDAIRKSIRSIKETIISGVKTNSDFLINVLKHEKFIKGECDTNFIADTPELFNITPKLDPELSIMKYIGEKVVNETRGKKPSFNVPVVPKVDESLRPKGTKQILDEQGPQGLVNWIKSQKKLLVTDTTMRDAHQSLMATRVRTRDMEKIAAAQSVLAGDIFSMEMWGGATFDVAYRFLKECPWERVEKLREKIPNVLFQMLLRGANAVGYKNYPDNVIRDYITESAKVGIDVFRIFDSLNWLKGMEVAIDQVLKEGKIAEACMCYTGDILDSSRGKYTLKYYVNLAKEIEKTGTHILGIKDMSGLLKPYAAYELIKALKDEISIPIHLHTHDTTGNGVATVLMATQAGVDIADLAFNSMSALTSQPALNSVAAALRNTERDTGLDADNLQKIANYWEDVRPVYSQFESGLKSSTAEIYKYEIPGGQYSNLKPQVESFGLGDRFEDIKEMYKKVNALVGDIVKVTPSSKMVGDLAIFMVQNNLDENTIYEKGKTLNFPDSTVSYFQGMMGQPMGGFPEELQKLVLKGEKPLDGRPGEFLPPEDFEKIEEYLTKKFKRKFNKKEILSYALYSDVFENYLKFINEYGDLSRMDSDVFFYGLTEGEMCEVEIGEGKSLFMQLLDITKVNAEGCRFLVFEVNGNKRDIQIKDKHAFEGGSAVQQAEAVMADEDNEKEIGASIPGSVIKVLVKAGDEIEEGQTLIVIEAMKMETNVTASVPGVVEGVFVKEGQRVKTGELLVKLK